jgi:N-acetyltransferase
MNEHWIDPIFLLGKHVTLEPMELRHVKDLQAAARDGQLWKLWYTSIPAPENTRAYVKAALQKRDQCGELPFVIHEHKTNKVIGSTRFMHVDSTHHRLEIGCSWYAQSYQRSAMNTEAKLLLLTHAFEQLSAIAVEFRTHHLNQRSRQAIERLGAKQDGILRNHQRSADGSYRDTVVYSIIDSEWPTIKKHLHFLLG